MNYISGKRGKGASMTRSIEIIYTKGVTFLETLNNIAEYEHLF